MRYFYTAMEFAKVSLPPPPSPPPGACSPPPSLLAAAACPPPPPPSPPPRGSSSPPPSSGSPKRAGFTVGRAVASILDAFFSSEGAAAAYPEKPPPDRFSLLVAEDDGTLADPDFPEVRCLRARRLAQSTQSMKHSQHTHTRARPPPQIDQSVAITSVGVDKFVLVLQPSAAEAASGGASKIVLRVTIPQSAIALRACEMGMASPQLALTCYLPAALPAPRDAGAGGGEEGGNGGLSKSFVVVLEGKDDAVPVRGMAVPSAQLAGLLQSPG